MDTIPSPDPAAELAAAINAVLAKQNAGAELTKVELTRLVNASLMLMKRGAK